MYFCKKNKKSLSNQCKRDFIRFIEEPIIAVLANDFKTQPDYYQDYKLESEPILSEKELLKKFQITEIVDSISNYQDHMSKIQLIPLVNEHVKRVMRRAKKLYIFGVYVYDFFIVAEHYWTPNGAYFCVHCGLDMDKSSTS